MNTDAEAFIQREYGPRSLNDWSGHIITGLAALWSLFQLALPHFLILNSEWVRAIHLAFALCLVFLSFPAIRNQRLIRRLSKDGNNRAGFLYRADRIHWNDYILAAIAVFAALYLIIDYNGIAERQGAPLPRDLIIGCTLILLLLDAARRALGPALATIALLFILYSFFSEYMPSMVSSKNASLSKVINKLTLSTEGIYGVPLDVSASVVFLFVLFGSMLEKAGGGKYFIDLAYSALGRYKGGPAKAAVLASGLTGMVNGSSIANTVTTGTFTIPLMKSSGFPAVKAGAIEVAASTNGQLMPPIMGAAAFIIAEYCNLPYLEVVRAAFIPAFISYFALIYITHLEACKLGLKGIPKEQLPVFFTTLIRGIHFLIPLGFLLYQLIIERRSAQLSAYYAIISLAALVLVREVIQSPGKGWGHALVIIWDSLVSGARNMMGIGVAVAAAGIIVGIVTLGLGSVITDLIGVLSGGSLVAMLLITAVVSLVLGMGLPTTANYIVMASLTVPAIITLSANSGYEIPLIAAHLFCFYFGILSDDTPPVGLSAYAAAAISKADPIQTGIQGFKYDIRTAILPFMFIFNTDLLLLGIEGWWHIGLIFFSSTIAMFAFASLTQNWLMVKNRFYESILLIFVTLTLLRPEFFNRFLELHKMAWYAIGIGMFIIVHLMQLPRRNKEADPLG